MVTRPVGSWVCQAQVPEPGAEQLEVGHHQECADVQRAGPAPHQEAEQAEVPEGAERVGPGREEQPPPGVQAAGEHGRRDQDGRTPVHPGRAADRQGAEVDQAVPRRHERRDVARAGRRRPRAAGRRCTRRRWRRRPRPPPGPGRAGSPGAAGPAAAARCRPRAHAATRCSRRGPAAGPAAPRPG